MQEDARSSADATRSRTAKFRILVVDDDADTCEVLREVLAAEGYQTTTETSALRALDSIAQQDFDLVLSDVSMSEMSGLELCKQIVAARPAMPVILLTGQGTLSTVTTALRLGARDFLTKPVDAAALVFSVNRALRPPPARVIASQLAEPSEQALEKLAITGVLGRSSVIRGVYKLISELRGSAASVLLQGETGTGKEIIARAIHANSNFKQGPFVALNCAAMPVGLLESELFGHARGAFTDAKTSSKGLFLEANGGTLLLDEIGELPLAMQPKLLRALQERTVRPVGEHTEIPFDCRLITATNRDLALSVANKEFREDLYYRLDVVRITVPPLRERGDDVLLLAQHFLERFANGTRLSPTLSDAVREKLLAYRWPGNVRELENCMERAVALTRASELCVEDLPDKVRLGAAPRAIAQRLGSEVLSAQETVSAAAVTPLSQVERSHILGTVERLGGNKTLAADQLGIDRRTLYRHLKHYESESGRAIPAETVDAPRAPTRNGR